MPYRVEFPPATEKNPASSGGLSLPKNTGESGEVGEVPDPEGRIIAVLIASTVLEADIWLTLDDSFDPRDGLAVFHVDEVGLLATKDPQTLREIHAVKLAFPGSKVRQ
jgi:hypothetical protein